MNSEQSRPSNPLDNTQTKAGVAIAAVAVLVLAWCYWPSSHDQDPGPPRLDLNLDVTQGERLHDVKRGKCDQGD